MSGCTKQTIIEPEAGSGENYYIYVATMNSTAIYVIDAAKGMNAIIDSINGLPSEPVLGMTTTSDGAKLYIGTGSNIGALYSVDTRSKNLKRILNYPAKVFLSPSGYPFFVAYKPDTSIIVGNINPSDDQIAILDSFKIHPWFICEESLTFDKKQSIFYAVNAEKKLFAYNYVTKKIVRVYNNINNASIMIVSPDGTKLYAFDYFNLQFNVFDLVNDESLALYSANSRSSFALSTDEKYLYLTGPSRAVTTDISASADSSIWVYDIASQSFTTTLYIKDVQLNDETNGISILSGTNTAVIPTRYDIRIVDLNNTKSCSIVTPSSTYKSWIYSFAIGKKI
jgi:hypothetical protein